MLDCPAATQEKTCRVAEGREILLHGPVHCNEIGAFFREKGDRIQALFLFIIQPLKMAANVSGQSEQVFQRQCRAGVGFFRERQDVCVVPDRVRRDQREVTHELGRQRRERGGGSGPSADPAARTLPPP